MHSLGKRGVMAALLIALGAAAAMPSTASAGPEPGAKRGTGVRLFARSLGALTINRVYYGLSNQGLVGVDSTNSSTIGGGFWPRGTGNQYMFNSGLQIAGVIRGQKPANPWGGDTTGGFFFDPKGTTEHGVGVTDIWNATNVSDVANWPAAGLVPQGDESEELFSELLRGRVSASQGDVWWVSWEGDPGLRAGRPHPLGIVAEYRGLGWNYPTGNNDILYFIITFYNITSLNPADYATYRPAIREILIQKAQDFHALNNATFGITLPTAGYTIDPFYAAFAADPDVASAGANHSSVQMPLALGYTYDRTFSRPAGWSFDPAIFGAPFFAGAGFVGIKYLKSPTGEGEIQLYSNTTNGGSFPDPANTTRLFKYLSGTVTPADGVSCNQGNVLETKICYVNPAQSDVRLIQSSTPLALPPGGSGSIVVAYVHAAPVQIPGYVGGTAVDPGNPLRWESAGLLAQGANRIDSISGFAGYTDANGDDQVQQDEVRFVSGSMIGKALTAQTIFDAKFLLPFAPDAPEFFLIPGDNTVTVLWKPSAAETQGDAFFEVAKDATVVPAGGGAPVVNALYDPNYRKFDVEGYRIYRGRVDSPNSLRLLAQFDYNGTTFRDFRGRVTAGGGVEQVNCAPEIGVTTGCLVSYTPPTPGVPAVNSRAFDLSGQFVQAVSRTQLASGGVITLEADSAVTGNASGKFPELANTGVPFVYVDNDVVNGLIYYYAVTAFDVNSRVSGPSSLESARATKRVVPNSVAGNYANVAATSAGTFGRSGLLTDNVVPTLNPTTGRFSKRFPTQNGTTLALVAFVKELIKGTGEVSLRLDSIKTTGVTAASDFSFVHYYTATTSTGTSRITVPFNNVSALSSAGGSAAGSFTAITADANIATQYGGGAGYTIAGQFRVRTPSGYFGGVGARGCVNGADGYGSAPGCYYQGPRWYAGENETEDHPNKGYPGTFNTGVQQTDFRTAGALPGVVRIHRAMSYNDKAASYRDIEAGLTPFIGAADYRLYWGDAGKVDSVVDLTHNVLVPMTGRAEASWGFLNGSQVPTGQSYDQRAPLTLSDFGCVSPIKEIAAMSAAIGACTGAAIPLSDVAIPGPVVFTQTNGAGLAAERTAAVAPNNGIGIYIKGRLFLAELEGGALPAKGATWTMRDYIGAIRGGVGASGSYGNYVYTDNPSYGTQWRQMTAVGASVKFAFQVQNELVASTDETLAKVHTVPDPYYVTSAFEATTTSKVIRFVNLPAKATIRIYTTSGVLVRVLQQETGSFSGELTWDVRNRNNQFVASGVYFYHVTAENGAEKVGRMTIVNYAQ